MLLDSLDYGCNHRTALDPQNKYPVTRALSAAGIAFQQEHPMHQPSAIVLCGRLRESEDQSSLHFCSRVRSQKGYGAVWPHEPFRGFGDFSSNSITCGLPTTRTSALTFYAKLRSDVACWSTAATRAIRIRRVWAPEPLCGARL